MMLKGKAKEQFEKWYTDQWTHSKYPESLAEGMGLFYHDIFYSLPLSMQYGVYIDWLSSVGILVMVDYWQKDGDSDMVKDDLDIQFSILLNRKWTYLNSHGSLDNARMELIDKAASMYNERS